MGIKHTTTKTPGQKVFAVADWNADHQITSDLNLGAFGITTTGAINSGSGTITHVPAVDDDVANKKYVDDNITGAPEGTEVLSTGEVGGVKYLREDGDGTCSWQEPAGAGDMTAAVYDPATITEQLVGLIATQTLTNKTLDDFSNLIHADNIHLEVRNESGGAMARGDAVFISGYSVGQEKVLVDFADNSSASTMPCIAIIEQEILANNATGQSTQIGIIENMKTDDWSVGDTLYITATGTTGNTLTNTKPTGTALIQKVATVLRSHATLGIVEVFGAGRSNELPNIPLNNFWLGNGLGEPTETNFDTEVSANSDVSSNTAASHAQSHNIASHSDTSATGAELDTLTGGGDTTLHDHDGISENTAARHAAVTLNANATAAGLSLSTQEINYRAATNAQTGYATAAHIQAIEANTAKDTNVTTNLSLGVGNATTEIIVSSDGTDVTLIEADTDNAGLLGADKWDEIVANSVHTAGDGSDHADVAANTAASHAESHSIVSHNDTSATGAELNTLTGGGDTTLHDHAGISENTAARHNQSHTIASHSDTSATGAELTTVADGATAKNSHTHTHASTTGRTANDHHAQSHTIVSHSDTSATGAELNTLTGGGDTTLHDHAGISENTAARHTQNTDTALGSGAVAANHGTASTDQIINVSYGTSATPPTASTTTEGSLYVQYTA